MQPQRDRLGRFLPGHSGGPGRPKRTHNPAYQNIVEEVITPKDWRAIVKRLKHYALDGDPSALSALRLLAPYLLGRPTPAAPQHDANEDPSANPPPSQLVEPPAQASPSLLEQSSQPAEREKSSHDEPIDNVARKHLVLKSAPKLRRRLPTADY